MTTTRSASVYDGLRETLISPNEADRNLEPANVVDGLYAIMRAIHAYDQTAVLGLLMQYGTPEQQAQALEVLCSRLARIRGR